MQDLEERALDITQDPRPKGKMFQNFAKSWVTFLVRSLGIFPAGHAIL